MDYEVKNIKKFSFIEEGEGEPLILLHGLFGALSNFEHIVDYFKDSYKVVIPILPILEMDLIHTSVTGLAKYINKFVIERNYSNINLLGNSLGGHVALIYVLKHPETVKTLILTGSSGLFESGMGDSYPKRGDKEYIRKKAQLTFYDPAIATDELVEECYAITTNRMKVLRIIAMAKSAIRNNLGDELKAIHQPTCLIWGNNDIITPPFVAHKFNELIENSELHFIDKCGHAPMMEVPDEFNRLLEGFLSKQKSSASLKVT